MVIGGFNGVRDVEIVNIGHGNNIPCTKPANLDLFKPDFGTGTFFNGSPIVCKDISCATYSFTSNEWTIGPNPAEL